MTEELKHLTAEQRFVRLRIQQREWRLKNKDRLAEYRKRWRASERDPEVQKAKLAARSALKQKIRSGKLDRGVCCGCGSEETEAHHPDYCRPLLVVWLCRKCHILYHVIDGHIKRVAAPGSL